LVGRGDSGAFMALCAPDLHYEDPLTRSPLLGGARVRRPRGAPVAGVPDVSVARAPASA